MMQNSWRLHVSCNAGVGVQKAKKEDIGIQLIREL